MLRIMMMMMVIAMAVMALKVKTNELAKKEGNQRDEVEYEPHHACACQCTAIENRQLLQ